MTAAKRTSIFHKTIVEWTLHTPIALTVDSPLKRSKNEEKSPFGYIGISINGTQYWLTCETQQIANDLVSLQNQTVWVQATGSYANSRLAIMLQNPNVQDGDLAPTAAAPPPVAQPPTSQPSVAYPKPQKPPEYHAPVNTPSASPTDPVRAGFGVKEALLIVNRDSSCVIGSPQWEAKVQDLAIKIVGICDKVEKGGADPDVPF